MCARRQRMAEAVRRECRVATEVVGERLDRVRRAALEALAERELVDRVVGMDQVGSDAVPAASIVMIVSAKGSVASRADRDGFSAMSRPILPCSRHVTTDNVRLSIV